MVYERQRWAPGAAGGTPLSAARLNHIEDGIADAHQLAGGILLDSFPGGDDEKLTAAIGVQQRTVGMPPIVLAERNHVFNQTRELYSGLKLIGARPSGPKNLELAGGGYVPSRVTLGGRIGSARSSWWISPGRDVYDVFMADFAIAGDAGRSVHQFLDFPVTAGHTLFACEFRSLSFDFLRAVFGRRDRPCALTQVVFSGHWTANNLWDTQFTVGGSDNTLWMGGQINIGPSASHKQTGGHEDFEMIFSSLGKTNVGYIYLTALNGWRGLKITGDHGMGLFFYGGTYEGYRAGGDKRSGPAPGSLIRIEGGSGAFYGPNIGQGMADPHPGEGGLVHQTGGEWSVLGACFFRGSMPERTSCMFQSGGRMTVMGVTRAQSERWTGRPRYGMPAGAAGRWDGGPRSFVCLDGSMEVG